MPSRSAAPALLLLQLLLLSGASAEGSAEPPRGTHVKVSRWWHGGAPSGSSPLLRLGAAPALAAAGGGGAGGGGAAGLAARRGFELCLDLLHKLRGGVSIGGVVHSVELTWIDSGADERLVVPTLRHLVDDLGIKLLLGPHGAALTEQAAAMAQERGALLLTSGAAEPGVFQGRPMVFGTLAPMAQTLLPSIELVASLGARSFAVLKEDGAPLGEACDAMPALAQRHSLDIVFSWTLQSGAGADMVTTAAVRVAELAPDVVVGCMSDGLCHQLLRGLQSRDFNPKAIIVTACVTATGYLEQLGSAGQFVIGTAPWAPELPLTSELLPLNASTFSRQYGARYHGEMDPPYQAALAFATCEALVYSIERAGSAHPPAVAESLRVMDKQSVFGRMAFDQNGQIMNQAKVVQFQDSGRYHVVAPNASADRRVHYPRPSWTHLKCFDTLTYSHHGFLRSEATGAYACRQCPRGKVGVFDLALSHRVCQNCSAGHVTKVYLDRQDEAFCEACPSGTYSMLAGSQEECSMCPKGRYQSLPGQSACSACRPGSVASFAGARRCEPCAEADGGLTFFPQSGGERCRPCPEHGLCEKDADGLFSSFTNQDGYYLHSDGTENGTGSLHRCPHGNGAACLARGRCLSDASTGEQAMEGPLCGLCRPGFGRDSWLFSACEKCPRWSKMMMGCLLNFVLLDLAVGCMTLLTAFKDFSKPTYIASSILKQLMNYLQMSAAAFSVTDFDVIFDVKGLCRTAEGIFGLSSTSFSNLSMWCFSGFYLPGVATFKVMTAAGLAWAPAVLLGDVLKYALLCGWCSLFCLRVPRPRLLMSFITLKLYISLPRITELVLIPFGCFYADTSRHLMDTTVDCTSDDHWTWYLVGLLGFVVYSLGIPFLFLVLLWRCKAQDRLAEPRAQAVLGFLVNGLEPDYYYFECVFMLRKVVFLLLLAVPGYSEVSSVVQCFSLTFVSGFFLLLHLWFRPYDNRAYFLLDQTEAASLLAIFLTLVAQIGLWATEVSMVFQLHPTFRGVCRAIVFGIVFGLHVRFLLLALWGLFLRAMTERCLKSKFHACIGKGRVRVTENGLQIDLLSQSSQQLLEGLFVELIGICCAHQGRIRYDWLRTSLQRIFVHANYVKRRREYERVDPLRQPTKFLRTKAKRLPVGGNAINEALQKAESSVSSWRSLSEDCKPLDLASQFEKRPSLGDAIEELSAFSRANLLRTYGTSFAVEDLYEALLLLRTELCKDGLEQAEEGLDSSNAGPELSIDSLRSSDEAPEPSEPRRGSRERLEAELEAVSERCERERHVAAAAASECEHLRVRLAGMECGGGVGGPACDSPRTASPRRAEALHAAEPAAAAPEQALEAMEASSQGIASTEGKSHERSGVDGGAASPDSPDSPSWPDQNNLHHIAMALEKADIAWENAAEDSTEFPFTPREATPASATAGAPSAFPSPCGELRQSL